MINVFKALRTGKKIQPSFKIILCKKESNYANNVIVAGYFNSKEFKINWDLLFDKLSTGAKINKTIYKNMSEYSKNNKDDYNFNEKFSKIIYNKHVK